MVQCGTGSVEREDHRDPPSVLHGSQGCHVMRCASGRLLSGANSLPAHLTSLVSQDHHYFLSLVLGALGGFIKHLNASLHFGFQAA